MKLNKLLSPIKRTITILQRKKATITDFYFFDNSYNSDADNKSTEYWDNKDTEWNFIQVKEEDDDVNLVTLTSKSSLLLNSSPVILLFLKDNYATFIIFIISYIETDRILHWIFPHCLKFCTVVLQFLELIIS